MIFRKRFGELIDRQLTMFASDHAELVERITRASEAYDDAPRDEAEERYGEYQDLLAEGAEILVQLRDNYAATLDDAAADEYEGAFNYAVLRRFGDLALELEDEPDA
ncbi:MAG TPA: hypothetical protein VE444_04140 [Gaiellaceae bacterium]|nr:hypothetical protein [Gaiellaceae bacterium]